MHYYSVSLQLYNAISGFFISIFEYMPDITSEIKFRTARSGGGGGQHVNKVETMVEAYWDIASSQAVTDEERQLILQKLSNRINSNSILAVKSQEYRSQLSNKIEAEKKLKALVEKALTRQKKRKATKPTAASRVQNKESKQKLSERKILRKKIRL